MLKKTRIVLAALFFVAITLLFLGISGELTKWFGWLPKLQFLPAVLAVNVGVIILLVLLTLVCGRIYCSVICPLGVYQDIVSWLSGLRKGKKLRFKYQKELKWLRYGVWVLFVIALIAGVQVLVALLAPYSAYGRMIRTAVAPASVGTVVVAVITFVVVTVLAWIGGRTYCNSVRSSIRQSAKAATCARKNARPSASTSMRKRLTTAAVWTVSTVWIPASSAR